MIKCISYMIVGIGLGYGYGYLVSLVELIIRAFIKVILLEV
jgi:hypothetical protein